MIKRTIIAYDPFDQKNAPWNETGKWPCSWIAPSQQLSRPYVLAYRLRFTLEHAISLRLHVSADERYALFVDGAWAGYGPERGDALHWYFETYDVTFEAGSHVIVAQTWALGEIAPIAQCSVQPGFLLCPEEEAYRDLLATGRAPWEARQLDGYTFHHPMSAFAVGHTIELDGTRFAWDFENGTGQGWSTTRSLHSGFSARNTNEVTPDQHLLLPATLPPMLNQRYTGGQVRHISTPSLTSTHALPIRASEHLHEEQAAWDALLAARAPLTIPAHTRRRILIDLQNYVCAYPDLVVSHGEGGSVRVCWQESLFVEPWNKGHRGEIEGKYFVFIWWQQDGLGDSFHLDGGTERHLTPLWWRAGRYVELLIEANNEPLTIERLSFRETRYPLELESTFTADDERLRQVIPLAFRTLQMCAHETYMDCPFYEQLMYIGDTRLECLLTYISSHDDRLPRKALRMFDYSRLVNGLTQSRYPSRLRQIIPPFSLWWVAMIHDYLMWRDDLSFVRALLPGMQAVLDAFTLLRDEEGLVHSPAGWNYMDWLSAWESGEPEGAREGGVCVSLNWLYIYALQRGAEVAQACGEPELAARSLRLARQTLDALDARYWCADKGLYADDSAHTIFSEHSQCLAILSRLLPLAKHQQIAERLFHTADLLQPSVYFMHYFFETCQVLGRADVFFQRLQFWYQMHDLDFKTTYENADPTSNRSDCHAWAAHPLYHCFATILGIRPGSPGFRSVIITPQLGPLTTVSGELVHPRGKIRLQISQQNGKTSGEITLPAGVQGTLFSNGREYQLEAQKYQF